jgi:hypothetical protein
MNPSAASELPQPGVDDRHAGLPGPPGVEREGVVVLVVAVGPRAVVLRGDVRERRGDLVEEVAPGSAGLS